MATLYSNEYASQTFDIDESEQFLRFAIVDDEFGDQGHLLTREEAIAAARAILKHFNAGMEE